MMWRGVNPEDRPAVEAEVAAAQPLQRFAQAEEIARAALFLVSDPASFITGAALVVDGGPADMHCDDEVNAVLDRVSYWASLGTLAIIRAPSTAIRFYDLRHTTATPLLAQGVHSKIVQERFGHSQISLTLDTYSHVLPEMGREAASNLDALLT